MHASTYICMYVCLHVRMCVCMSELIAKCFCVLMFLLNICYAPIRWIKFSQKCSIDVIVLAACQECVSVCLTKCPYRYTLFSEKHPDTRMVVTVKLF